jgi:hypothetical protein
MNFSKQQQPIALPVDGDLQLIFDSSSAEFGGLSKELPTSGSPKPAIQPESIIIYTN